MLGKETSVPFQDIGNSHSRRQMSHVKNPDKENHKMSVNSRKWGRSITDKDDIVSKRQRMDINNENSEFPRSLQDGSRQDLSNELYNVCQTSRYIPHQLTGLMYRLDLSVLCLLRKFTYKHKYSSLTLVFEDSEVDKFNDIVLLYEEKSIHIQIKNVDKYYTDNDINYAKLFT